MKRRVMERYTAVTFVFWSLFLSGGHFPALAQDAAPAENPPDPNALPESDKETPLLLVPGEKPVIESIRIECNSQEMIMKIDTDVLFNGLIYPKGLSRNTTCMTGYELKEGPIDYVIPLWSCNTMSTTLPDGSVEYFNTIVVQPHRKLVTSQGRGYHVRCKYQTQEKVVRTDLNISSPISRVDSMLGTTPLTATAAMPGVLMRIFYGDATEQVVAENVRIGDPLTMEVALDSQEIYGLLITNCYVRDGIGQSEQPLINDQGCPVDEEIMGPFTYAEDKRSARVQFQAHKFPYTPSVYYQCTVKLCINSAGGCDIVPPNCNPFDRVKRQALIRRDERDELINEDGRNIQVFSGLYVSEDPDFEDAPDFGSSLSESRSTSNGVIHIDDEGRICIDRRDFMIYVVIIGLILILLVIFVVFIIIITRRRRRGKEASTTGSSIYSGPYSNGAYSHSS